MGCTSSGRIPGWALVALIVAAGVWPGCAAPKPGEAGQRVAAPPAEADAPTRKSSKSRSNIPDAPAPSPGQGPTAAMTATDPCATRLHDLCGPLLHYYALNRRLPDELRELQGLAGADPALSFDCPVSARPYVYVPGGFPWGDKPGFIVLHDAEPSHSGFRWAVVVEEPRGNQPLLTRVVAVPEPLFLSPGRVNGEGAGRE
jgi:hypothetical protein